MLKTTVVWRYEMQHFARVRASRCRVRRVGAIAHVDMICDNDAMGRHVEVSAMFCALVACAPEGAHAGGSSGAGDDMTNPPGSGAPHSESGDRGGADAGPTHTDDDSQTEDGTTGSGGGGEPQCGNGVVEGDEMCDEANGIDGDGCNEDCTESGAVLWEHTHVGGGGEMERLFAVVTDDDGNVYVTGRVSDGTSGTDLWIRQYTADGGLGWTVSIDGGAAGHDSGQDIARFGDVLYVVGALLTTEQSNNWHLGEYTLDGGAGWSDTYNGAASGDDRATGIAVDVRGNLYAAGWELSEPQDRDILVRQYLPGGAVGWSAVHATAGSDGATAITVDLLGNVVVTGWEDGEGQDVWVRKYDPTGRAIWTQTYQGEAGLDDLGTGVATDADGNIVVVGGVGTANGTAWWVRFYDSDGLEVWTRTWEGPSREGAFALGVAVDNVGDIVVVGSETDAGIQAALVRKYELDGNLRWSQTYASGAVGSQAARSVAIGTDNQIWIAGSADLGIDLLDAWIARIAQ